MNIGLFLMVLGHLRFWSPSWLSVSSWDAAQFQEVVVVSDGLMARRVNAQFVVGTQSNANRRLMTKVLWV